MVDSRCALNRAWVAAVKGDSQVPVLYRVCEIAPRERLGESSAAGTRPSSSRHSISTDILPGRLFAVPLVEIEDSVDLGALEVLAPGRIGGAEAGFEAPGLAGG